MADPAEAPASYRDGCVRDRVDILKEVTVRGPGFQTTPKWGVERANVRCRATELAGEAAYQFAVRGFKKPWIVQFAADPGLSQTKNRLLVYRRDGSTAEVRIVSYRDVAGQGIIWTVEGDEITTTPPTTRP